MERLRWMGYWMMATMVLALGSCDAVGTSSPTETFAAADRPAFVRTADGQGTYQLLLPWNYGKSWNSTRKYPLVIGLHGAGGSDYKPEAFFTDLGLKTYPCLYLTPACPSGYGGATADWIATLVRSIQSTYRLDMARIYLVGFSMGGSGSYELANILAGKGIFVAGIVRVAGASQTTLDSRLADQTGVWYHIGLNDDPDRLRVATDAFTFLKTWPANRTASLEVSDDRIGRYRRKTFSVVKAGHPVALKSEYTGLGHDDGPVYQDPTVLRWLFRQTLGTP